VLHSLFVIAWAQIAPTSSWSDLPSPLDMSLFFSLLFGYNWTLKQAYILRMNLLAETLFSRGRLLKSPCALPDQRLGTSLPLKKKARAILIYQNVTSLAAVIDKYSFHLFVLWTQLLPFPIFPISSDYLS
jgi:hypothetical protein